MYNLNKCGKRAMEILERSEEIVSANEADAALSKVALGMEKRLAGKLPLCVTVMGGAVMFAGRLLPLLSFPLESDHACVSRYGKGSQGGEIIWRSEPKEDMNGRTVVILDDLLDEGKTLANMKERFLMKGAREVLIAVWFDKTENESKRTIKADWAGMALPSKFVFGCGMDIEGYWRNLPSVRVLSS